MTDRNSMLIVILGTTLWFVIRSACIGILVR